MINLNELESRWLRYKIKSYIPHFVILLSLIFIALVLVTFDFTLLGKKEVISYQPTIQKLIEKKEIVMPKIKQEVILKKEVIILPKPIIIKEKNSKVILQPSLNFMNNLKHSSPQYYQEETRFTPQVKQMQKAIKVAKKPRKIVQDLIVEAPKVEVVHNQIISIQRQNTHDDIEHVVKRFKNSHNPALSLFVAKKYYELGDYNQAYNYALITNELNNDIEESWIIFTKALIKLNKKDKAIEILNKYIANTHSQRAKILLDNIKSGKMK